MLDWISVFVLAVIEGFTEFLPISSTGHMILASEWMGLEETEATQAFIVIIQGGAILAVVTAYRHTLMAWLKGWWSLVSPQSGSRELDREHRLYSLKIAGAVIPFGFFGFMGRDVIMSLFTSHVVATGLLIGGLIILGEGVSTRRGWLKSNRSKDSFTLRDCLLIGLGQCLSLWPGFSRAAATILSARFIGFSRPAAAELSFLIGLPTILGTSSYEMTKVSYHSGLWPFLVVGSLVAWIVAYVSVKWFTNFLHRFSMDVFGWYRVAMACVLFAFFS